MHDIDLICWILGKFPRRVLASASAHVPEIAALGDHDTVAIIMEFDGGAIGTVDLSRNAVYGYDQRLEVGLSGGARLEGSPPRSGTVICCDVRVGRGESFQNVDCGFGCDGWLALILTC